jgi:hypothetical protein
MLGLFGVSALGLACLRRGYAASWRDELVLLVPAAIVLILVSAKTGFTHHLRYVLPAFPFAFVWISKVARAKSLGDRGVARVAAVCLLWSVGSSLCVYPHSLSYFNELIGGPTRGHDYLLLSNIDWGQDLLYLKRWLDAHPEARPLYLQCSAGIDPDFLGVAALDLARHRVPTAPTTATGKPRPGWHAVSVSALMDRSGAALPFLRLRPTARAGYSILIYQVRPDGWDQPD